MTTITGLYQALKMGKGLAEAAFDSKVDAEVKDKVGEIKSALGMALEKVVELQTQLYGQQEEIHSLRESLRLVEGWQAKEASYALVTTAGGAVVPRYVAEPFHYACPSCFNKQEIHPLQPNRTASGKYRCTGCAQEFPIEERKPEPAPAVMMFSSLEKEGW